MPLSEDLTSIICAITTQGNRRNVNMGLNQQCWLLLNTQVALIVVNKLFGEVAGTEYSLAAIWSTLLISIAALVTNLFTPMTYSYYAKQDRKGLIHFTSTTVKIVGLLYGVTNCTSLHILASTPNDLGRCRICTSRSTDLDLCCSGHSTDNGLLHISNNM
jgi:hypothetical protein